MAGNPKNLALLVAILKKYPSQRTFAAALGVPETVVSRTLNRRWVLRPDEKRQWAKLLGISVEQLEELME